MPHALSLVVYASLDSDVGLPHRKYATVGKFCACLRHQALKFQAFLDCQSACGEGPASLPAPFAHAQSVAWPRSQSFATSTPWQGSAAQRLAPSMLGTSAQLQSAPASFHLSEDTNVWATNASWGTPGPGPRPGQAPAPVGPIVRQATVLRTTLGERRPLTESRIRPS